VLGRLRRDWQHDLLERERQSFIADLRENALDACGGYGGVRRVRDGVIEATLE